MCGRYVIFSTPEAIRALFRYGEQPNFPPRYNVAPTQPIPVVRLVDGKPSFALMRWGLLPVVGRGAEDISAPDQCPRRIGARQAGISQCHAAAALSDPDRRLLRMAGRRRRAEASLFCARQNKRRGTPTPLAFAGLWETWTGPNGEELDTAAIVTTDANRTLAAIHPRMPVFVPPEAFDRWLDCDAVPAEEAASLIKPADDALLEAYPISPAVNRVANDSDALIAPISAQASFQQESPSQVKPNKIKKSDDQPTLF